MTDNVLVRSARPLVGRHVLSPKTSDHLGGILEQSAGKPRDELRFPVSPAPVPTDLLLYEQPDDPSKKFYIPRYSVAIQSVSGKLRYRVLLTERESDWALTVHLVKAPAEALGTAAREATEFPHLVQVEFDYRLSPGSSARKQLEFQEITRQEAELQVTLVTATLAERDEVFQALTDPGKEARLIVKRLVDVALPLGASEAAVAVPVHTRRVLVANQPILPNRPIPAPPIRPIGPIAPKSLPQPQLAFVGKEDYTAGNMRWTRYKLSVTNWNSFAADFFQPSPDLPPCGANTNASRTWVDIHDGETGNRLYGFCALSSPASLNSLWFARPQGQQPPATVYISMVDRRANVTRNSNKVATTSSEPPVPIFQETRLAVDNVVPPDPFAFLPELHGYIFDQVTPMPGGNRDLVRTRLGWLDKFHTYLQDPARPHLFYYLPDSFKISRRPDVPFVPFMTVRVQSLAGSTENTDVVLDYVIAPDVDRKRLDAARSALVSQVPSSSPPLELQPFITSDVRFFVDRPTRTGSMIEERSGASLVLQGALKDTLVMKLPDFQVLFDAMIRRTASLFLGRVEVEIPGWDTESIPFSARMDDLAGETFLYAAMAHPGGELSVTLTNAIESPLRINGLAATVSRGGTEVPAAIAGLDLPIESLAPGEHLTATVTPSAPLDVAGLATVEFDTSDVDVLPDPEAIWNAILDRSTLEYYDTITVKAIAVLFEPIAERPSDHILAILIEFEGGDTAELSAERLEDSARVDYPIDDVILRRSIDRSYRYWVTVIRADGRQERDAEPRQRESRTFFVNVVR